LPTQGARLNQVGENNSNQSSEIGQAKNKPKPKDFIPRCGDTLIVGVVARISGCASQKEVSLDDQIDSAKEEVLQIYPGPTEYRVIATRERESSSTGQNWRKSRR
jgi:hypothetical protein